MERILVTARYLKIAHYFFFSMVVLSLTATIAFWSSFSSQASLFLASCIIYGNASIWLAYLFYRDYSQEITKISVLGRYARPYVIIAFVVVLATEGMTMFFPNIGNVVASLLFINYYYVFIVVIGGAMYALKPVRRLFVFQASRAVSGGMMIAAKYSRLPQVKKMKPGVDPIIDEMLDDIWEHRAYPVEQVKKLEIEALNREIDDVETRIAKIDASGKGSTKSLEGEKKRLHGKLLEIMSYDA